MLVAQARSFRAQEFIDAHFDEQAKRLHFPNTSIPPRVVGDWDTYRMREITGAVECTA